MNTQNADEPHPDEPYTEEPYTDDPLTDDPRPDGLHSAKSLLVVNTGNGKGKSTAAFGIMVRGIARGWQVAVLQFVKSGEWKVGEETIGRQLGVHWQSVGEGFTWDSDNLEHDKAVAQRGWAIARDLIQSGHYELIVLDELTYLMTWGWIDSDEVIRVLRDRPLHVNVIVTGRDASPDLIAIADTATEMREIKHAYTSGIAAKRGIDY